MFRNQDLRNSNFSGSDLRGADFTGAQLDGVDFTNARTGITPVNTVLLFLAATVVSALSGYVSMLAGRTVQIMLASDDLKVRFAGIASGVLIIAFILFTIWKGGAKSITHLIIPVFIIEILLGIVALVEGIGTGKGFPLSHAFNCISRGDDHYRNYCESSGRFLILHAIIHGGGPGRRIIC